MLLKSERLKARFFSRTFGELRGLLQLEPSGHHFELICDKMQEFPQARVEDEVLPYVEGALRRWPMSDRMVIVRDRDLSDPEAAHSPWTLRLARLLMVQRLPIALDRLGDVAGLEALLTSPRYGTWDGLDLTRWSCDPTIFEALVDNPAHDALRTFRVMVRADEGWLDAWRRLTARGLEQAHLHTQPPRGWRPATVASVPDDVVMRLFEVMGPAQRLLVDINTTAEVLARALLAWPHLSGLAWFSLITPYDQRTIAQALLAERKRLHPDLATRFDEVLAYYAKLAEGL